MFLFCFSENMWAVPSAEVFLCFRSSDSHFLSECQLNAEESCKYSLSRALSPCLRMSHHPDGNAQQMISHTACQESHYNEFNACLRLTPPLPYTPTVLDSALFHFSVPLSITSHLFQSDFFLILHCSPSPHRYFPDSPLFSS